MKKRWLLIPLSLLAVPVFRLSGEHDSGVGGTSRALT